ncbi:MULTISPECIES: YrzQ family protein [Heyndrickxia]|nr:YrzQ family protein [Heyndrickxia oleronia]NYV64489.1 YrzQ family protein [Bacillus sp. Gen3]MBU5213518.1 YrzQ family protein [Heyndrickxia oleronia]MCI1590305.1 YrzQ family protein [Heyndrickxia oleronia]MCI1614087.1 YrzQ family protein [Heyndrickxia oleronia]MCI1745241.1 YrzQ family protein [Heyndrickxia oleronia]
MNKTVVSLLGFGAGIAATAISQRQGYFDNKQMKKMTKRLRKAFK